MSVTFSASRSRVEIDPVFSCRLCLSDCPLTQAITLSQCRCVYCRECMMQYLHVSITDGCVLAITCPDGLCHKQGVLSTEEIRSLVTDEIFEKYKRLKFEREVELDPHRTFCPEVGCEAICHVCNSPNDTNKFSTKPISCPSCGLEFCSVCKAKWHGSISCDEHMMMGRPEDEGIPFSSLENAQIKRCPLCHVPIERNDGCAQMMCRRCKHVFCWYCLASLDDDFFLRHYDRGPCKNKLGHSRASVMWHRTQVVGIFAGFSVLLIMATPFLLLAAPCILCCKCKFFKCCKETETQDSVPSSM